MHVIYHWKALDKEIEDGEYQFDWTYSWEIILFQTLNVNHVEIMKVSDKPMYNTSFESSRHGDLRF